MKKSLILFAALAFLASCQMSEIIPGISKDLKVFTGTLEDNATRVALIGDGDVYHVTWNIGDKILINDVHFNATVGDVTSTYFVQDTSQSLVPPTAPYIAFYPATVSKGLPSVQNYVPNNVEFIPMRAESGDEVLPFKNLVGILKLNIMTGDAGIVVKRIVITADQGLSGEFTVENGVAVVSGSGNVTINCGDGVAIGVDPIPFFVTVPANTYTGMTIKVYTTDGKVASVKMKSGSNLTVERSKVYAAEFPFNGFTALDGVGGVAVLPSGPDFNAIVKQIAMDDPDVTSATLDAEYVTRIVFNTLCTDTEGTEIQDLTSDKPIYLVYDKASGVMNVNTPAATLKTPEDVSDMFYTLGAMKYIDNLKCLNTEDAVNMSRMFCFTGGSTRELREIDLSNFNTSNVTNMRSMFNGCRNVKEFDLSSFNTENVESMAYMFQYCTSVEHIDLSNFNTESCENMMYMFAYCSNLLDVDVSSFNTENVTNISYFFGYCYKLQKADVSNFVTENCTDLRNFFRDNYEITDINVTGFSFASATDVRSFLYCCYMLPKIDLSSIDGEDSMISSSASCGYFFFGTRSLREINVGNCFRFPILPSYPFSTKSSPMSDRCGSEAGGITIYCDQDMCDYWATSGLRWLEHGYTTGTDPVNPIHTTFIHYKTGVELFPAAWPAD